LPAVAGTNRNILRHCARRREAQFFHVDAVVEQPASAGGANAAPLDFLGGYEVAYFEIAHVLANFCHSPGELVTEDVGEACKTGIEHVAVAAALVHMH